VPDNQEMSSLGEMTSGSVSTPVFERARGLRRRLHTIPELGYQEFKTAEAIREELAGLGISFFAGVDGAPTATVAVVGDPSKPCIAMRADIDALPIHERTGLPYASQNPGIMHACGHDGHSATLVGVAAELLQIADTLPICVKLLWQPAEEGGAGGKRLCDAGVLDGRLGPKVKAIFGLHGWPELQVGTVSTRPGPLLAATDSFTATFVGKGCHGAFPHLGRDPIVTAAEAVINLQQFVSRDLDPTDSAVITVGKFHAGTATNVIPDRATIEATARTLTEASRSLIRQSVQRRCAGIAHANGCELEFTWEEGYPATINDPDMAAFVAGVARSLPGVSYLDAAKPVMGGEDFAYYLQQVPGCFFMIGTRPSHLASYPGLHSDRYDFTDEALSTGIRTFVALAQSWKA
jgi:amidohydrolase